jgi:drug/metabolite transporter (DMT)-like permease
VIDSARKRGGVLVEPFVAALLWGGVFAAAKISLVDIPALSYILVRILIAAAALLIICFRFAPLRLSRSLWRPLLAAGLAQTLFQLLLFEALARTSASISAILLATAPLLTAGWLAASGRERLAARQWIGLLLGLVGVGLVVHTDQGDLTGATLLGNLLALGSAVAWASYGLTIGGLARQVGPIGATTVTLSMAALVIAPFGAAEALAFDWSSVSVPAWLGVLYGSLLGLVLATLLWVRSIGRYGTQPTMNYGYVEPVAAVVIAAVLLGEGLHLAQGLGAILALSGVALASSSRH